MTVVPQSTLEWPIITQKNPAVREVTTKQEINTTIQIWQTTDSDTSMKVTEH